MVNRLLRFAAFALTFAWFAVRFVPSVEATGTCHYEYLDQGYYYAGGGTFFGLAGGQQTLPTADYAACLARAQDIVILSAGGVCYYDGGIDGGQYGVGYITANWDVWWNDEYQGHVQQQYDCGDVSF